MLKQAQLITYADRLAGDLPGLRMRLTGPSEGAFGGVHLLPFVDPIDGADAGFDPIDHQATDPAPTALTALPARDSSTPRRSTSSSRAERRR